MSGSSSPPDLPLEVLSIITSLLSPPYYPAKPQLPSNTSKPTKRDASPGERTYQIAALDPQPPDPSQPLLNISQVSKASHTFLEASRPWLWENVDVRSGRGWLAVVNALTEEVHDQEENEEDGVPSPITVESMIPGMSGKGKAREIDGLPTNASVSSTGLGILNVPPASGSSASTISQSQSQSQTQAQAQAQPPTVPTPAPGPAQAQAQAPDAHVQPNTIPGGLQSYLPATTAFSSPFAIPPGNASALPTAISSPPHPTFSYSPPQPSTITQLLTPQGSRNPSPHPINSVLTNAQASRLRGRSRSPRRSIGFDTEGISAVLDRSRSASQGHSHSPSGGSGSGHRVSSHSRARSSGLDRRSSLSRTRTFDPWEDEDEDEENEDDEDDKDEDGDVDMLEGELDEDGHWINVNPELLPTPGPYIRHLTFTNFRTIGSRRTQDEAIRGRFVTAGRLEGVIKNAPNLVSICMTEYVDSSLSYSVLEELFFRGQRKPRIRRRLSHVGGRSLSRVRSMSADPNLASPIPSHDQLEPNRPTYVPYEDETEEDKWFRRSMFTPLEALDLTGCVSGVFTEGMEEFWERYFAPEEGLAEEDDPDRGRGRARGRKRGGDITETETEDETPFRDSSGGGGGSRRRMPIFPALERLSLRACWSLDTQILNSLLPAFPNLTHLDLSNTKISNPWLMRLTQRSPRGMKLQSLSLARCAKLDPYVIVDFLVRCPAAFEITELNLYVNPTAGNAIRSDELSLLLTAPCFRSGKLRFLDLSSAKFTPEQLSIENFPPQPNLVSLGLSYIPNLTLPTIAEFLLHQAPNVEILTLTGTASDTALRPTSTPLQITLELFARLINPVTTVPFSLDSLHLDLSKPPPIPPVGPTKLRVIEVSSPIRKALTTQGGSNEWQVVRSKGGRGWFVDTSAGWIKDVKEDMVEWRFARHLAKSDPWRKWLVGLSEAGGRVSSSVGWHSRKMEIVRGWGMMGREEGMAGAGAFAFEE